MYILFCRIEDTHMYFFLFLHRLDVYLIEKQFLWIISW
jgi:hypothetical protein